MVKSKPAAAETGNKSSSTLKEDSKINSSKVNNKTEVEGYIFYWHNGGEFNTVRIWVRKRRIK